MNTKSMKKLFSTAYSPKALSGSMLIMRCCFGGLMIPYGFNKLIQFGQRAASFPDPFHIGHTPSLLFVMVAEFFCAILVVLGLLTRLACIPLIITMVIAIFYINHGKITGGGESSMLFLCGYLSILLTGPGRYSMDRLIGK